MADAENKNFEFGIENFKPYSDLQSIELGKITLIYGSNSSGKSSFIQSFLCAAQSSESSSCSLRLNGDFVECGTFDSVLNRNIRDQKKEVVVSLSRSPKILGSSFSIQQGRDRRIKNINFSLNLQIQLRSSFRKSSTPGVLEISRIELVLPEIQAFKDSDPGMPDAWLVANKPLSGTKGVYCLEDIDGTWMTASNEIIGLVAQDLKECLRELSIQQSDNNSDIKTSTRYEIRGKYGELNLLHCASLRIGAWLVVSEFSSSGNFFTAYIYPSSMPYLEGKFFIANDISLKIKDLHNKIEKYFSFFEDCSRKFSLIRYSIGDESNASWGSIPITDQSVKRFAEVIGADSDCTKIRNQILDLVSDIIRRVDVLKALGSSLITNIGDQSQNLEFICKSLKKRIEEMESLRAHGKSYGHEDKNYGKDSQSEEIISRNLSNIFKLADQGMVYLTRSCDELRSTEISLGLDMNFSNDNYGFAELESSISDCKRSHNELKQIFGDPQYTELFLQLIVRLIDQIETSQRIIASKANDLDELAKCGIKERAAIGQIKILLNDIKSFGNYPQSQFLVLENKLKLIPVFKSLEILPQHLRKNRIIHLGPDRPSPMRSYSIDEISSDSLLQYLPEWDSDKQDLFPDSYQRKYLNELACLNIKGEDIVRVNTSDPLLNKCSICILSEDQITNICDLGFGVSQVMPIVIASKTPGKDLIVVQQPETHLHPAMQADLGDLLINSAVSESKDASIDTKKWLVETHSEVLMLRILRRLREGKSELDPSDVKIYFVYQSDDGISRIKQMKFTKSGDLLTRWPKGFFAQESMEL